MFNSFWLSLKYFFKRLAITLGFSLSTRQLDTLATNSFKGLILEQTTATLFSIASKTTKPKPSDSDKNKNKSIFSKNLSIFEKWSYISTLSSRSYSLIKFSIFFKYPSSSEPASFKLNSTPSFFKKLCRY